MNVEALQGFARFQAARAATDILDTDVVVTLGEASTEPRILRRLHELPIAMLVSGFGDRRVACTTTVEPPGAAPDEEPISDFDALDILRTPKGQMQRQIMALREGGGLPYREHLARRLEVLLDAFEDEGETWEEGSPESLRQMLLFLQAVPDFRYPTVTVTPSATFRAQWQADQNNHFAADFLPDGQVIFVVFAPDPHHPDRVQRVSGIVNRADVMRAIEPYRVHRWAADAGA